MYKDVFFCVIPFDCAKKPKHILEMQYKCHRSNKQDLENGYWVNNNMHIDDSAAWL